MALSLPAFTGVTPYHPAYAPSSRKEYRRRTDTAPLFLVDINPQPRAVAQIGVALIDFRTAWEHLAQRIINRRIFLNAKLVTLMSRCILASTPTGEISPGPCHAVRTPCSSLGRQFFRRSDAANGADVTTDIVDQLWVISGFQSLTLVNSSPIEIGVEDCWRGHLQPFEIFRRDRILRKNN